MKVIIRSSSSVGRRAKELIEKEIGGEVIAFVEPVWLAKKQKSLDGVPVISQYQALQMYKKKGFDKYVIPGNLRTNILHDIEAELKGFEIQEDDIIVIPSEYMDKAEWTEEERGYVVNHHEFRYLRYLEFHVADHCNLNCHNCTHFSPMVKGEVFADYETVKTDLLSLKKLVDNIGEIRIMGGECLLNPELERYIPMVKEIYPYTKLYIVTNGILVRKMKKSLIDIMLKYSVEVHMSVYPPLLEKVDEITDFLDKNGLPYAVVGPISEFYKVFDLNYSGSFPFKSTEATCGCFIMHKGTISMCAPVCLATYYDESKGTKELEKVSENGVVELATVKSFKELKKRLITPCELCNRCLLWRARYDEELREKWKRSNVKMK